MRAFVLAGGLGTRLRSLFGDTPKGLVPVGGVPVLELQIGLLAASGIVDIVLCVGHGAEAIEAYFGDGRRLGVELAYSRESAPLGTAGALRAAASRFTEPSAVLNGDTYLPLDWPAMARYHRADARTMATLAVVEAADAQRFGTVKVGRRGRILQFREKRAAAGPGVVSAGFYVLDPCLLAFVREGRSVSIEHQVFPQLVRAGQVLRAFPAGGPFFDMGTPDGHRCLEEHLA
jgi:NDP-sugar pyrophosphorylase family protein